jgi:hypothetical protein
MKTAHTRDMNKRITIMQSLRDDKYKNSDISSSCSVNRDFTNSLR